MPAGVTPSMTNHSKWACTLEEVLVPQPGDIIILCMDMVDSVAHLKSPAWTKAMKTIETDSYLAYVTACLDMPDERNEWHTCLVTIFPEPPSPTGVVIRATPLQHEIVRIRTRLVRKRTSITLEAELAKQVEEYARVYLESIEVSRAEYDRDAKGVTMIRHPVAKQLALPGTDIDLRPLVDFSYEWPEDGLYDPVHWLHEYDQFLDAVFEHRIEELLTQKFRNSSERALEMKYAQQQLQTSRLENTIRETVMVKQIATNKVPQRLYLRTGSALSETWLMHDLLCATI